MICKDPYYYFLMFKAMFTIDEYFHLSPKFLSYDFETIDPNYIHINFLSLCHFIFTYQFILVKFYLFLKNHYAIVSN